MDIMAYKCFQMADVRDGYSQWIAWRINTFNWLMLEMVTVSGYHGHFQEFQELKNSKIEVTLLFMKN